MTAFASCCWREEQGDPNADRMNARRIAGAKNERPCEAASEAALVERVAILPAFDSNAVPPCAQIGQPKRGNPNLMNVSQQRGS